MTTNKKQLTSEEAVKELSNSNLVVIAGVFDLLHFGHLTFIRKAKSLVGDAGELLVITYPDNIIKEHKGSNRPIMNEIERVELLCELESVDYVTVWPGWENVSELVEKLSPKYLATTDKSYEYSKENKWKGKTWETVAEKINAKLVKFEIEQNFASSKYSHLFE